MTVQYKKIVKIKNLFILLSIINLANLLFIEFFSIHSYMLTDIVNLELPIIANMPISLLGVATQLLILVLYIFFNRFIAKIMITGGLFISYRVCKLSCKEFSF